MEDIETLVSKVQDIEFWRDLAPALSVSDAPASTQPLARDAHKDAARRERLIEEGYLRIPDMGWEVPFDEMARVMVKLKQMELPPALVGVYDAPWIMAAQMRGLMDNMFAEPALLVPDFWAWIVAPGQAGFPLHRDRPKGAIDGRGRPHTITVWAPVTHATVENGAIYVQPANYDANYLQPSDEVQLNPQDVRAVPARPGDVLMWTGRVVHWGGRSSRYAHAPRLSIAWEFQTSTVAPVEGMVVDRYPAISFSERLSLIARQMIFYRKREFGGYLWERLIEELSAKNPAYNRQDT